MRYWGEDDIYIKGECEHCDKVLKIKRIGAVKNEAGFSLEPNIKCFCGTVHSNIIGHEQKVKPIRVITGTQVRCPKCTSTQIAAGTKGFGLGKAALGGLLLGPLGLLSGFIGSKTTMVTCLKCGYKWEAGK